MEVDLTCYHPKKGFVVGLTENGKKDILYKPYTVEYLKSGDGLKWLNSFEPLDSSQPLVKIDDFIYSDGSAHPVYFCKDFIQLPCGQCIGCRIDKSKEWANRMMLEAKHYEHNVFLTLTYDDEHLPVSEYEDEDGNVCHSYSLRKRDFQLFMKRLRKRYEVHDPFSGKVLDYSKIRFYACGEYGSKTFRPHYHAIIFNLELKDLKLLKRTFDGWNYYTSDTIAKCWPYGFHMVTDVTWETCAYTARYVTKKLNGAAADFYEKFMLEPEFSLMSRRPGLGRWYYEEEGRDLLLHERDIIRLSTPNGPLSFKPPKYYDALFDLEYPEVAATIRERQQKIAADVQKLKLEKTSLSLIEMLAVEEYNFKHKIKSLERGEC